MLFDHTVSGYSAACVDYTEAELIVMRYAPEPNWEPLVPTERKSMLDAVAQNLALAMCGLVTVTFAGCSVDSTEDSQGVTQVEQAAQSSVSLPGRIERGKYFTDSMDRHRKGRWYVSDGWSNGDYAMNDWRKGQAKFKGSLRLTMGTNRFSNYPFSSGEVQSKAVHGHGYYETTMRAARGSGLVSGFFTYTGPPFNQPWNEIDIEILGKQPDELLISYHYRDGKVAHVHKLGFDSSLSFNTYGFDWQPGFIEWYVNGEPVFRATAEDLTLPDKPQKIYMSLLGSRTLNRWAGRFDETALPASVEYRCVGKSESAAKSKPCWERQMAIMGGST
ncbi:MAG: family 16 glycosylhydrolase [Erythrobacter sp.]|nr:family 16 glycosylhydrolase [Erythrobacter sp.]